MLFFNVRRSLLLLLLWLFCTAPVCVADWTAYKSDNFLLYTDGSPKQARQTLQYVEQFRQVLKRFFPSDTKSSPTTIVMYSSYSDFRKVAPRVDAGAFHSISEGKRILIIGLPVGYTDRQVMIQHLYTSYYLSLSKVNYPSWFYFGMAEFFSVTELKDNIALIGNYHERHTWPNLMPLMPLKSLIANQQGAAFESRQAIPTSWNFIHLLLLGSLVGAPDYSEPLVRYLELSANVATADTAFVTAFGKTTEEMDQELDAYRKRGVVKMLRLPLQEYSGEINSRVMENDESLNMLANIAKQENRYDLINKYLKKMDKQSPTYIELRDWLSQQEAKEADIATNEKKLLKQLKSSPDDPLILAELARLNFQKLSVSGASKDRLKQAQKVIDYGEPAVRVDPSLKDVHQILHGAYSMLNNRAKEIEHMYAVYRLDPANANVAGMLGLKLHSAQRYEESIPYLEQAMKEARNKRQQDFLQKTLDDARKHTQQLGNKKPG